MEETEEIKKALKYFQKAVQDTKNDTKVFRSPRDSIDFRKQTSLKRNQAHNLGKQVLYLLNKVQKPSIEINKLRNDYQKLLKEHQQIQDEILQAEHLLIQQLSSNSLLQTPDQLPIITKKYSFLSSSSEDNQKQQLSSYQNPSNQAEESSNSYQLLIQERKNEVKEIEIAIIEVKHMRQQFEQLVELDNLEIDSQTEKSQNMQREEKQAFLINQNASKQRKLFKIYLVLLALCLIGVLLIGGYFIYF